MPPRQAHPAFSRRPAGLWDARQQDIRELPVPSGEVCAIFWDAENICVPCGLPPRILARGIRDLLPPGAAERLKIFTAYGNMRLIPDPVSEGLRDAAVDLSHVAAGSKNGSDFVIIQAVNDFLLDLPRDQRCLLVLISSDRNFLPTLASMKSGRPNVRTALIFANAHPALVDAADFCLPWDCLRGALYRVMRASKR